MIGELVKFGASFNWLTPLVDLYKDFNNGPHHDFWIDRHCGKSAGHIKRLLKRHGVSLWGLSYTDDLIIFRVRKRQAWWSQNVMLREGLPIVGGLIETGSKRPKDRKTHHNPGSLSGMLAEYFGVLNSLPGGNCKRRGERRPAGNHRRSNRSRVGGRR